jgi:hypothetical protein
MPFWWLLSGLPRAFQRQSTYLKQHDDQKTQRSDQWPILGPNAFAPAVTSLKRAALPQWGHFARTVSSSSTSYSSAFSHISWKHFGQVRTCVDIGFLVHSKTIRGIL